MVPMFLYIQLPSSSPGSEEGVPFRKVGVSGHTTESGKLKRRSHMVKSLESAMLLTRQYFEKEKSHCSRFKCATHAFSSLNNSVFFFWWKLKIVASVVPFLPHFF